MYISSASILCRYLVFRNILNMIYYYRYRAQSVFYATGILDSILSFLTVDIGGITVYLISVDIYNVMQNIFAPWAAAVYYHWTCHGKDIDGKMNF